MSEAWKQKQAEQRAEEEDEVDDEEYKAQKDAILFAILVSQSMLERPPPSDSKKADTDSATSAALKCAYQIMQQRIISNPRDMMGVLLFGTEATKFQPEEENSRGGLMYPHCYLVTDLDIPDANDVKALKSLVEDEEEASKLLVPAEEEINMSNILFCANQIFTTRAPNFGSRRLFIITDRDEPHANDKAKATAAAVRAKDLYDLGVSIELFPISQPDHEFDRSKFYDDIIYRDLSESDDPILSSAAVRSSTGSDGISLLTSLISNINSKQVPKRALFSNLHLEIGPGFSISVKGYNVLQRQKPAPSGYIWLGDENNERPQIAKGETVQTVDDIRKVEKVEIKKAYRFGGQQVLFTPEEQKEMKNFGAPIIRIIGFKPQSMLPKWAAIHKSTFIFPSEEDFVGSTRVFSALWQKLLKDKKMGLAWYVARANAKPQIVAIIPSAERLDEKTKQQVTPAGLWLYPLPFADDLRQPPEIPPPLVSPDNLVDKMRTVIQQLQLPAARFDPAKYPNPSLQWHYRILQAIALEEEIPDFDPSSDDKTLPKYKQIHKRAGPYVIEWGEILEEQYRAWQKERGSGTGVKREAEDGMSGAAKKTKLVARGKEKDVGSGAEDMKKLYNANKLGKATVAELKAFLGEVGLDGSGRKGELVDRVEQYFERK